MPVKSLKPRFEHWPVHGIGTTMQSYCLACKKFVAASDKLLALRIAEKAHICPKRKE